MRLSINLKQGPASKINIHHIIRRLGCFAFSGVNMIYQSSKTLLPFGASGHDTNYVTPNAMLLFSTAQSLIIMSNFSLFCTLLLRHAQQLVDFAFVTVKKIFSRSPLLSRGPVSSFYHGRPAGRLGDIRRQAN